MYRKIGHIFLTGLIGIFLISGVDSNSAFAAKGEDISVDAQAALIKLYQSTPGAKELGEKAKGILVFPQIIKGGFIFGGQYGDGALLKDNKAEAYYRSFAASYGLQAGVQTFGYVLFFMTEEDLKYLGRSDGWELGVGPSIVIMDEGKARNLSSTTLKDGVYAFVFGQKGLMAGIGIEGTKITQIHPKDE